MAKHFTIDARAVIHLGRENVRDSITAILELVKNAYDAGAEVVAVHLEVQNPDPACRYIRIIDNGSGMSESQLEQNWLRIGWSEKREAPVVGGRVQTGEKGIGRLSADRLGSALDIASKAEEQSCAGLRVDWDSFLSEQKLESVDIIEIPKPSVDFSLLPKRRGDSGGSYRQTSGTSLVISGLRQDWTWNEILSLREDLRLLGAPFGSNARQDDDDDEEDRPALSFEDFDIYVSSDVKPSEDGFVEPLPIATRAPLDLHASVTHEGEVSVTVRRFGEAAMGEPPIPWKQFRLIDDASQLSLPLQDKYVAGPMALRILFLPRKADVAREVDLKLHELKSLLDRSGGIRIYRDGVWLKPYGKPKDPAFDWLGLGAAKASEPSGASRERFRIGPNQIIGAVGITRALNPNLVDSVGREGLIQNEAFAQLQTIVRQCLSRLESAWTEETKNKKPGTSSDEPTPSPRDAVDALAEGLKEIQTAFRPLEEVFKDSRREDVREAREAVKRLVPVVEAAGQAVDEYADQALVLRALASVGIASSVFAHETQNHLAQAELSVSSALTLVGLGDTRSATIRGELEKVRGAVERLTAWGAFTLGRIARDARIRQRANFADIINRLLDDLEPSFQQVEARVERNLADVSSRIFPSDLESLVLNLMTNAYAACKQSVDRRVRITLFESDTQAVLTVADSGPGVSVGDRKRIWEPLFTTKVDTSGRPVGTGLGLPIVRSILNDLKGSVSVDDDPILKGARFVIQIPLRRERAS